MNDKTKPGSGVRGQGSEEQAPVPRSPNPEPNLRNPDLPYPRKDPKPDDEDQTIVSPGAFADGEKQEDGGSSMEDESNFPSPIDDHPSSENISPSSENISPSSTS